MMDASCRRFGQICLWLAVLVAGTAPALCQGAPAQKQQPAVTQQSSPTPATAPVPAPPCSVADGFTLVAVGDVIYSEPLAGLQDQSFQSMLSLLRNADATFGNLENTLIDLSTFAGSPQAEAGGGHARGAVALARDMRNMGFNLVSRANNHATDWGVEGMRATDRAADEAGLVHAGSGYNKTAARAAHYLQTNKGRVALVAMTSSPTPISVAADPLGTVPGRAGVSALRLTPQMVVSQKMMKNLREIHDAQPKGALEAEELEKRAFLPEGQDKPEEKPDRLSLFGVKYRVGDNAVRFAFDMNESDLREILKSVRHGKQNSDFLIATIHSHEPDNWSEEPADFLPKLAHSAIDAGADTFIGHGPHRLWGIEIYQGKPIFYSLGNFIFDLGTQEPVTPDMFEAIKANPNTFTDHEAMERIAKAWFDAPVWYQSVIAVTHFEHGKMSEVRLYPIDLGYKKTVDRGIPRLAAPEMAASVLQELQRLSKPYGTTITIENNVGVIRLDK